MLYMIVLIIFLILLFACIADTITGYYNLIAILFIFMLSWVTMFMINYHL